MAAATTRARGSCPAIDGARHLAYPPGRSSHPAQEVAMDFPIGELLDEGACYDWLVRLIHPGGLTCPRCGSDDLRVHRDRDPVLDYRCPRCERVFNAFTHTALHKTHYRPSEVVLVLRGFARGESTAALARAGPQPPPPARAAAPAPGQRPGAPRRPAAAGRPRRGGRDVPERGGKKGSGTPTRPTRRGGGRGDGSGWGRGPRISRRCWGSSAGPRAGCGCGWVGTRASRS